MPQRVVPPSNRQFARAMRQEMTKAELRLWSRLRKPGLPGFRFQGQVPMGPYIVDFLCPEHRLVIEVDGGQHGLPEEERRDRRRDEWLREQGFRVLRFWNREILTNLNGVCEAIMASVPVDEAD